MWTANRFLVTLLLVFFAGGAFAQTTCSGSNTSLSLGVYPSYNASAVDSSGPFTVTCNTGQGGGGSVSVMVGLGPSFNSGSITTRSMKLTTGADLLDYNLYRDPTRLAVWGQTVGVDTMTQSVNTSNNNTGSATFTFFGRINALQDIRAGDYSDTVIITVTF